MAFFRNIDPQTTGWISKVLGEQEMREAHENLSYGANTMRDGISLSEVLKQRILILPTEISTLKDLECFVKLPEGLPVTKIRMGYKN
jgi:type IV secretory pathway TraG/TraD family ATPase VirD4